MGNCVTDWVFRRQRFCCCLPARLGAGLLALLTLLVSGLLMVILWFEVATDYFMSGKEKTAFILAGILETFLFIASVLGFIGVCARKQSFVVIFSLFLYVHFFINLGVAAYFLWMVTHTANKDIVKLCEEGIRNEQAQGQCKGLLNITKAVYWVVSLTVLAVEAYCTLVVTRYVNQLRYEKRDVRRSRLLARQSAYDAFHARFSSSYPVPGADEEKEAQDHDQKGSEKHYSSLSGTTAHHDGDLEKEIGEDKEGLLRASEVQVQEEKPFDPYAPYDPHPEYHDMYTGSRPGSSDSLRAIRSPTPSQMSMPTEERSSSRSSGSINLDSERDMHRSEAERRLTTNSLSDPPTASNANADLPVVCGGVHVGVPVPVCAPESAQSPNPSPSFTSAGNRNSPPPVVVMALPPGAAPAIPPTIGSRVSRASLTSSRLSRTFSPPPSYQK